MDSANKNTVIEIIYDRKCGGCEYSTTIHGMEGPGDEYCGDCADLGELYKDLEKTDKKDYWDFLGFDDFCIYCKFCKVVKHPMFYFKCEKNGKIFNTDLERPDSSVSCPGFENGAFLEVYQRNKEEMEKQKKG